MGTNLDYYVPPFVTADTMYKALHIAAGGKWYWQELETNESIFRYVRLESSVPSEITAPSNMPGTLVMTLFDGSVIYWHYDVSYDDPVPVGWRSVGAGSSPRPAAIITNICEVLGGVIDYHDSDDSFSDFRAPALFDYPPSNGADFQRLQDAIASIKPVTDEDLTRKYPVELAYDVNGEWAK